MKRVLIDLGKLSNLNCGLGQVALNFGKALAKKDVGIEWHFLVPSKYIGYFGNDNVICHSNTSIRKHLATNYFDLWHAIHQDPTILPKDNTPIILTIHDLNFLGEKSSIKSRKRLERLQKITNHCQRIFFISEFSKSVAIEKLKIELETTKV